VNLQVVVLLPPLEQAPDQIALRPFETDKVTDVPTLNDAEPLLPVVTLIPAGLEVATMRPFTAEQVGRQHRVSQTFSVCARTQY
jgi:hypothetical protein